MGRVYVFSILFINFPAGLIMAFYANGLLPTRIAFIILDSLWFWFTLRAFLEIKKGNIKAHKQFMMRSYALTLSAITLRAWKYGITNTMTLPPMDVYRVVAWAGWVGNLVVAEYLIRRHQKNQRKITGVHSKSKAHSN